MGESGDKAENEFSAFIPLAVPRKGFSPHIPASRLFVLFHPTKPTIPQSAISDGGGFAGFGVEKVGGVMQKGRPLVWAALWFVGIIL